MILYKNYHINYLLDSTLSNLNLTFHNFLDAQNSSFNLHSIYRALIPTWHLPIFSANSIPGKGLSSIFCYLARTAFFRDIGCEIKLPIFFSRHLFVNFFSLTKTGQTTTQRSMSSLVGIIQQRYDYVSVVLKANLFVFYQDILLCSKFSKFHHFGKFLRVYLVFGQIYNLPKQCMKMLNVQPMDSYLTAYLRATNHPYHLGSGCETIGRAVASDTRGLQFESQSLAIFI